MLRVTLAGAVLWWTSIKANYGSLLTAECKWTYLSHSVGWKTGTFWPVSFQIRAFLWETSLIPHVMMLLLCIMIVVLSPSALWVFLDWRVFFVSRRSFYLGLFTVPVLQQRLMNLQPHVFAVSRDSCNWSEHWVGESFSVFMTVPRLHNLQSPPIRGQESRESVACLCYYSFISLMPTNRICSVVSAVWLVEKRYTPAVIRNNLLCWRSIWPHL